MRVEQVNSNINFTGYKCKLKTLYKKNKLPQVTTGFYGDRLSINNCSVEHLKPISKGGISTFDNMVLASKDKNNKRSDKPLSEFLDLKAMTRYLNQFRNIEVDGFNGNNYIAGILKRVGECLQKGF